MNHKAMRPEDVCTSYPPYRLQDHGHAGLWCIVHPNGAVSDPCPLPEAAKIAYGLSTAFRAGIDFLANRLTDPLYNVHRSLKEVDEVRHGGFPTEESGVYQAVEEKCAPPPPKRMVFEQALAHMKAGGKVTRIYWQEEYPDNHIYLELQDEPNLIMRVNRVHGKPGRGYWDTDQPSVLACDWVVVR